MTIEHKNNAEANLHEDKGASTATIGQIYRANGAGSGTWGVPLVGLATVGDSEIDWANNIPASLQQYPSKGALRKITINQNTTAWADTGNPVFIYKPSGSNIITYYAEYEMISGTTNEMEFRLKTDTTFGTTIIVSTTKTAMEGTIDVVNKSGWIDIQAETRATTAANHTIVIYQLVYYFS